MCLTSGGERNLQDTMIYPTLRILSCFVLLAIPSYADINPNWKTFSTPDQTQHETLIVKVHNVTGDVYLASTNRIYHLDEDLVLKNKVVVGPGKVCDAPEINCTNTDKNYVPHSMEIAYHLRSLVICSSLYNGMCEIRPLDNLQASSWIGPFNDRVSLCTDMTGDPGFFGNGAFFSGADHHFDVPREGSTKAFFSSKLLVEEQGNFRFKYSHQTDSTRSAIFFNSPVQQTILYSFIYESYVYILFVRGMFAVGTTILARVCLKDDSFHSYTELPLDCTIIDSLRGKIFTVATSAYLGPGKDSDPSSRSLYVAFHRTKDGPAVCEYLLDSVNNRYQTGIMDCFKNGNKTNLIDLEDLLNSACNSKPVVEDSDLCGSSINPYISIKDTYSSIPTLDIDIPKLRITALAVIVENGRKVAFIGGKPAVYAKMIMDRNRGVHADSAGGVMIPSSTAFDLKQEHIYFLAKNQIIKYPMRTCSVYLNCEECFRAEVDPLHCGWCDGRCAQVQECSSRSSFSRDKCSPSIYKVSPLKSTAQGLTLITILGANFGPEDRTREKSSVQVVGTECRVMLWEDERILCATNPSSFEGTGVVEVNIKDSKSTPFTYQGSAESNQTFTFVTPKLYGILPDRGSIYGGTNITIFGKNFDIGDVYQMNIQGRNCTNLQVEKNTASCVTATSANASLLNNAIEMTIDGYVIGITQDTSTEFAKHFTYLPDPEIYKIHPTEVLLSFKGNITVTGRFLDSVEHPQMTVNISSIKGYRLSTENCLLTPNTNATVMTCSFPSLNIGDITLSNGETASHFATVKFRMYPFQSRFPHIESSKLWIYPDPWYEPFVFVQNVTSINQSILEIKGKYPRFESLSDMISVRIGEEEVCGVTYLTLDLLSCELPSELLSNESVWGEKLSIQVQTGSYRQRLGDLVIKNPYAPSEEPEEGKKTLLIALAVSLFLLICIVAGFGYWYFLRRRNKEKSSGSSMTPGAVTFMNDYRPVSNRHEAQPTNAVSLLGNASEVPLLEETTVPVRPVRSFFREPSTSASTMNQARTSFIAPAVDIIATPSTSTTVAEENYLNMNKKKSASTIPKMVQPLEPSVVNTRPELLRAISMQNECIDETLRLLRMDDVILPRERITIGEKINSGYFGYVSEGIYKCPWEGDIQVAVKRMNESLELTPKSMKNFLDEGAKMKDLHHDHVLSLIGICFENQLPMIVFPLMVNGDLCSYLRNPDIKLIMVKDLRKFATEAAAGMVYLAKNKYVHRDLAARNCVLDGALNLKVSDFGLTRDIYSTEYYVASDDGVLPYKWMAPEAIELHRYTVKSDVWSYGVLLWEIMTRGVLPYEEVHNWSLCEKIKAGLRLPRPKSCSSKMYLVMEKCWQLDPEKRPSFDTLYSILHELWKSVSNNNELQNIPAKYAEYANC